MKELHQEFGEVVYQCEIQGLMLTVDIAAKRSELIGRYGYSISGLLGDIYDDIVDHPEDWSAYARVLVAR
jgi:hypothetical protein